MTAESVALRPVRAINIAGVEPKKADTLPPEPRLVDPTTLLIDDKYQRALGENSMRMIRKVVGDWDWRRFKPPVVAETPAGLMIIDGQHTAIAAASHPDVGDILVMVVHADAVEDQAAAFMGHNRDRLGMTKTQLHRAAVAANDPVAVAIERVCAEAGVRVLKNPPTNGAYRPRDTMAVAAIAALIRRYDESRAVEMIRICAEADLTPVRADALKAVECLLTEQEFKDEVDPAGIADAFRVLGPQADRDAQLFAAAHDVRLWRALAIVLFRKCRRGRRRAS